LSSLNYIIWLKTQKKKRKKRSNPKVDQASANLQVSQITPNHTINQARKQREMMKVKEKAIPKNQKTTKKTTTTLPWT